MDNHKGIPPYIQRGLLALIVLLMGVSVARLLTRAHQQEERIEQLEEGLAALYTRLDRLEEAAHADVHSEENVGHRQGSYQRNWRTENHYNRRTSGSMGSAIMRDGGLIDPNESELINPDESGSPTPISGSTSQSNMQSQQSGTSNNSGQGTTRNSKYTEPRRFNLNHIDSLSLVRIPGIAAAQAAVEE